MQLLITPGIDRIYAVALVTADGGFERVSEHDTEEEAVMARFRAELASDLALIQLELVAA